MPATAQVRIAADTKQFKRAMDDVNDRIGTLGKLSRGIGNTLRGTFSTLGNLGGLTLFAGVPAIFTGTAKAFSKFEKDMMEVYTLLPNANKAFFEEMKRDALAFSEEFGIMPEEVSKGMYQAISSGISPEGLDEGFLKIAQEAAMAGVTDLRTSVDALTNVVNSYGDGVYDMQYVSDLMFKSVAMSKTTFRELADYMYQILPTAGSLKLRLDDLFGSISALAATGTLTRVGTTQLRQFLIEISRTGDKANSAFLQASNGVPFEEYIKQGGRLVDVVKLLGDYAQSRQISLRNLFGSVEAGNAALTLAKSTNFVGMVDALEDPTGAQAQATAKMADRLGFRFARITRTSMNNFIKLGQVLKPVFEDILTYMEKGMEKMRNFDWQGLGQRFQQEWAFIKKLLKDDKLFDYVLVQFKKAFAQTGIFILQGIQRIFDSLASMISIDSSSVTGLSDELANVASAFVDRILLGMAKLSPMLLSSLAPFLAFFAASVERIKANLTPDSREDMQGIRDAKTESFKERHGSLKEMLAEDPAALSRARDKMEEAYEEHGEKILSSFRSFEGMDTDLSQSFKSWGREVVAGWKGGNAKMANPEEVGVTQQLKDALSKAGDSGSLTYILKHHGFENTNELFSSIGLAKGFDSITAHLDKYVSGRQERADSAREAGDRIEAFKFSMDAADGRGLKKALLDYENYMERVVQISDEFTGATLKIDKGEVVFQEAYKKFERQIRDQAKLQQENINENYEADKKVANAKIGTAVSELTGKVKLLKLELKDLQIAPKKDTVAIKELESKITAFDAQIKATELADKPPLEDFKMPEPKNEGAIYEKGDPLVDEYKIRGFMPEVSGDSKTKIGAGGGFFSHDPMDRLRDSNLALQNSVDALAEVIANVPVMQNKRLEGQDQANQAYDSSLFLPPMAKEIKTLSEFRNLLTDLKLDDIKESFKKDGDLGEQSNQMQGFIAQWNKKVPYATISEDVSKEYDQRNFNRSMTSFQEEGRIMNDSLLETIKVMRTAKPVYDENGVVVENDAKLLKDLNTQFANGFNNLNEFLDVLTKISNTTSGGEMPEFDFRDKLTQKGETLSDRNEELNILEGLLKAFNASDHGFPIVNTLPIMNNANKRVAGIEDKNDVFRQLPSRVENPLPEEVKKQITTQLEPVNRVFGITDQVESETKPPLIPASDPFKADTPLEPIKAKDEKSVGDFFEQPMGGAFQSINPIENIETITVPFDSEREPAEVTKIEKRINDTLKLEDDTMSSRDNQYRSLYDTSGGRKTGDWDNLDEEQKKQMFRQYNLNQGSTKKAKKPSFEKPEFDSEPVLRDYGKPVYPPSIQKILDEVGLDRVPPLPNLDKPDIPETVIEGAMPKLSAPRNITEALNQQFQKSIVPKPNGAMLGGANLNTNLTNAAIAQTKASQELLETARVLRESVREKVLDNSSMTEPVNF
jgi:TP901 family phage tail tape measure protein